MGLSKKEKARAIRFKREQLEAQGKPVNESLMKKSEPEEKEEEQQKAPQPEEEEEQKNNNSSLAVPWFVLFLFFFYVLVKIEHLYNSPCAILGVQSPFTRSSVTKAYRDLSLCTHPDRLVRSGRDAQLRAEVFFTQVSQAREGAFHMLKKAKPSRSASCFGAGGAFAIESWIFRSLGSQFSTAEGYYDVFEGFRSVIFGFLYSLITFQAGIVSTIGIVLFLYQIIRLFRGICSANWTFIKLSWSILLGPFPTALRFFLSPFVRFIVFVQQERFKLKAGRVELLGSLIKVESSDRSKLVEKYQERLRQRNPNIDKLSGGVRRRNVKKKTNNMTAAEREARRLDALTGTHKGAAKSADVIAEEVEEEELEKLEEKSMWERYIVPGTAALFRIIGRRPAWKQVRNGTAGRRFASVAMQFDILLTLSKPVIPLVTLVFTGFTLNGLMSSLLIGHALRNWVAKFKYNDTIHFILFLCGAAHTILGVRADAIHNYADNAAETDVLRLEWQWGLKDAVTLANLALLGATFSSVGGLGNETGFIGTFASGLAGRIFVEEYRSHSFAKACSAQLSYVSFLFTLLYDIMKLGVMKCLEIVGLEMLGEGKIQFSTMEEVALRAGNGIGDCAGGPMRMLFGNYAGLFSFLLKGFLLILPVMFTCQWALKLKQACRAPKKHFSIYVICVRSVLCSVGALQCAMLVSHNLNAMNGSLAGFWVVSLFGIVWESLLSTYDVRGPMRQLFFLALFILL
eukprot:g3332.t1